MKQTILRPIRMFKFSKDGNGTKKYYSRSSERSSYPSGCEKEMDDCHGSSEWSLSKMQRRSIASSLTAGSKSQSLSYFMELDKNGMVNERRRSQNYDFYNSVDISKGNQSFNSETPSSTHGTSLTSSSQFAIDDFRHSLPSHDDIGEFEVSLSKMERRSESKKSRVSSPRKKKKIVGVLRNFLREKLHVPLSKNHQRWSRCSFDSMGM
jgi:hypothetical protein